MKIGIVTFFNVPNYGAMLQALALWKYLESRGHEVKFVEGVTAKRVKFTDCIARTLADTKQRMRRYVREQCTEFTAAYPVGTTGEHYDALVVGSDQVWNPAWMLPKLPLVFLSFAKAGCKRIAYAASFGVRQWGDKCRSEVSAMLRDFDAISVREKSGAGIVKDLCGRAAEVMPDPTLLWDGDFYRQYLPASQGKSVVKYVLSFMLDEWSDGAAESACAQELANSLGVKEIRTAYDRGSFPVSLICRIFDLRAKVPLPKWLELMDGASAVITNSFHGMVFAILFHKPFVVIKHKGTGEQMNDRVDTILNDLGLSTRSIYVDERCKIDSIVRNEIDWVAVDVGIKMLKNSADNYFTGVDA